MKSFQLFIIILVSLLLVQCTSNSDISRRDIDWHFIIPDDYQGFLVIKYNCSDGKPFTDNGHTIQVEFNQDGTFCATESSFAWQGQLSARTKGGQNIDASGTLWNREGYGLYLDQLITLYDEEHRQQFEIFWVGDMEYLASIRNEEPYAKELNLFLEDHFGVSLPH